MFQKVLNSLFGCSHTRTTFPLSPARKAGISSPNRSAYVVCLDCGKEFSYDWRLMRIGEAVQRPAMPAPPAPAPARATVSIH
jgi:hypothetical protein